jgi:hypothetical protein
MIRRGSAAEAGARHEESSSRLTKKLQILYDELENVERQVEEEISLQEKYKGRIPSATIKRLLRQTLSDELSRQRQSFIARGKISSCSIDSVSIRDTTRDVAQSDEQRFRLLAGTTFDELLCDALRFWGHDLSERDKFILIDSSGSMWPGYRDATDALSEVLERSGVEPGLILARRPTPNMAELEAWQPDHLPLRRDRVHEDLIVDGNDGDKGASEGGSDPLGLEHGDIGDPDEPGAALLAEKRRRARRREARRAARMASDKEQYADMILSRPRILVADFGVSILLLVSFIGVSMMMNSPFPWSATFVTSFARDSLVDKPFPFDIADSIVRARSEFLAVDGTSFANGTDFEILDTLADGVTAQSANGVSFARVMTFSDIGDGMALGSWISHILQPFGWANRQVQSPTPLKYQHLTARNYVDNSTQLIGSVRVWQARALGSGCEDVSSLGDCKVEAKGYDTSDFGPGCDESVWGSGFGPTSMPACWRYKADAHRPFPNLLSAWGNWDEHTGGCESAPCTLLTFFFFLCSFE